MSSKSSLLICTCKNLISIFKYATNVFCWKKEGNLNGFVDDLFSDLFMVNWILDPTRCAKHLCKCMHVFCIAFQLFDSSRADDGISGKYSCTLCKLGGGKNSMLYI
jgi:hypothetical protein